MVRIVLIYLMCMFILQIVCTFGGCLYDEKPQDIIKDVYTLEFLNLNANSHYDESELERKICANLQEFLLELGKGFTFVKEQFPMNINNHIYKCDLVFYHRILKCFVLIDLKVNAV